MRIYVAMDVGLLLEKNAVSFVRRAIFTTGVMGISKFFGEEVIHCSVDMVKLKTILNAIRRYRWLIRKLASVNTENTRVENYKKYWKSIYDEGVKRGGVALQGYNPTTGSYSSVNVVYKNVELCFKRATTYYELSTIYTNSPRVKMFNKIKMIII